MPWSHLHIKACPVRATYIHVIIYIFYYLAISSSAGVAEKLTSFCDPQACSPSNYSCRFVLFDHFTRISPCSLSEKWSGFFYVCRVLLSYAIHRDRRLKVSSKRLGNEHVCKSALPKGATARPGFEPGTSSREVWGLTHSATTAPHETIFAKLSGTWLSHGSYRVFAAVTG